jgi:hypothetical protein
MGSSENIYLQPFLDQRHEVPNFILTNPQSLDTKCITKIENGTQLEILRPLSTATANTRKRLGSWGSILEYGA